MSDEELKVETMSFCELIGKELQIPEYQRAYTWGEKNIDRMLEDFDEFLDKKQEEYYMGIVLLHEDKDKNKDKNNKTFFNIIDGQQRITTLILLNYICKKDINIKYSNLRSQKRIKENYDYLQNLDCQQYKDIFSKLIFTVITTTDQDKAFLFFDTQNNRGVKPSISVLLKAYNLRCIDDIEVQKSCAKKWELQEKTKTNIKLSEINNKIDWVVLIYLWRVRNWRGNNPQSFGGYEDFRDDFTKNLRSSKEGYKKYASSFLSITKKQCSTVINKNRDNDYFEFNTRQPLYRGECFFDFVDYYGGLLSELCEQRVKGKTFGELQQIFNKGSSYMASFFVMTSLLYYERFGTSDFDEFIENFSNAVANVRLNEPRITKQKMQIQFIRAKDTKIKQNILDFIAGAFDGKEVTEWLGAIHIEIKESKNVKSRIRETFYEKYNSFWGTESDK